MKGKVAFVLGAAVGYVLGTRAGRERYEQIKRGAQRLWNTEPVQRGVKSVRGAVDERADEAKAMARRLSSQLLGKLSEQAAGKNGGASGKEKSGAKSSSAPKSKAKAADEEAPAEGKSGTEGKDEA